jgi:N utilization substance protein B
MQMLYTMSRDKSVDLQTILSRYRKSVDKTFELYLFNLLLFMKVGAYARIDAKRKKSKHLPSEADRKFTPKLAENPLMNSLLQNQALFRQFKKLGLEEKFDEDQVRRFYTEFSETAPYKAFIEKPDNQHQDFIDILLHLYKTCINIETFIEIITDNYPLWEEDKSLVVGAIKKTIKALPAEETYYEAYVPSPETIDEFGKTLLVEVVQKETELLDVISPALKNWDADRVAVIDMILIKMAISEFIAFESIPTKVTLNEYVELAKVYSTDKSKDFVNGILDRLVKQLTDNGKIQKSGRGLVGN